jgi:hypothetical protein
MLLLSAQVSFLWGVSCATPCIPLVYKYVYILLIGILFEFILFLSPWLNLKTKEIICTSRLSYYTTLMQCN